MTSNAALQSTRNESRVPSQPGTNVTRLVYFERFDYIRDAIGRENGIKRMLHAQKIALIESMNRSGRI
jgi:predicted GIY-YIG superfamily endonuclease